MLAGCDYSAPVEVVAAQGFDMSNQRSETLKIPASLATTSPPFLVYNTVLTH
jgi:hypothetical protein